MGDDLKLGPAEVDVAVMPDVGQQMARTKNPIHFRRHDRGPWRHGRCGRHRAAAPRRGDRLDGAPGPGRQRVLRVPAVL